VDAVAAELLRDAAPDVLRRDDVDRAAPRRGAVRATPSTAPAGARSASGTITSFLIGWDYTLTILIPATIDLCERRYRLRSMSGEGGSWAETTIAALRSNGHRDGAARRAVVELLGRQHCCLTAQEIFDRLRGEGRRVGIATVYRVLEQLTKEGFVQRIDVGAATARFEPLHPSGEHHHHLVCADCGKVEAFEDPELERALRRVEGRTGYAVVGHDVVLRGACADCVDAS
jgi:Fur family ferric uptake transcriptional regulator